MRRWLNALAAVVIVLLAVGLYKAKTDAAKARGHVRELQTSIADTQADMRALRAEIAHLESPARVEDLAEQHLDLQTGSEARALPESAMDSALPAPRAAPRGQNTKSGAPH